MPNQIIPGAEPFYFPGGPTGCLLIHGFTANPQEISGLGKYLAKAGYSVLAVRLPGHGTNMKDLIRSRYQDWLAAVEDGYHLLSSTTDQIFAVGLSMGGVLAFHLAATYPLAGVAGLSTVYTMPGKNYKRWRRWLPILSKFYLGRRKEHAEWFTPAEAEGRVTYTHNPIRAVIELDKLLHSFAEILPTVQAPTLLIHSKDDEYVPPHHAEKIYQKLGSPDKELSWISDARHIITCDGDHDKVFKLVADFIRNHSMEVRND